MARDTKVFVETLPADVVNDERSHICEAGHPRGRADPYAQRVTGFSVGSSDGVEVASHNLAALPSFRLTLTKGWSIVAAGNAAMHRKNRRQFLQNSLAMAGLSLLTGCGRTIIPPQPTVSVPRIGMLRLESPADIRGQRMVAAFRQGLQDLGYLDGQNVFIDVRWAEGRLDHLPDLALELARSSVDVFVAGGRAVIRAVLKTTTSIPLVMAHSADPVDLRFVANLGKPADNITGLTSSTDDRADKRLELLSLVLPQASRVAILWGVSSTSAAAQLHDAVAAATALGLSLESSCVRSPRELDIAFAASAPRADGVLVLDDVMINSDRPRIVALTREYRLPAMYPDLDYALMGGLMSYGASLVDLHRRAAGYVVQLLRGASPGDLQIQTPTQFDFVINLATAQDLGVSISQAAVDQATEVIA